jgi:uncharacterized iron-regulated membrane protein
MRPLQPIDRIRRWHTYLVVWAVHRVLGLGAALLLVLLSFTGSLLVVHHELERLFGTPYRLSHDAAVASPARSWNELVHAAARFAPEGYRPFRMMPGKAGDEPPKVLFSGPDGRTRWAAFVDPRDGTVLWHGPDQALFTPWLLGLHMHLHIGPWGYVITGLAGLALFFLGATGLYLHRYDFAFIWRRPPWRWGRGWRAFLHDTHTWIGAISLYFSLVLGATGVAFAILIFPGQLEKRPPPPAPFDLATLAPIGPMLEAGRAALPGQELVRLAFPTTAGAPARLLLLDRSAPVWAKFSTVDFDAVSGSLLKVRPGREATTAQKWRAIVAPLHFGLYGAGWVKVAYALGGLAPGVLAITGVAIWWRRTRRNGRAGTPRSPYARRIATDRAMI